jgi:lysozyme
MRLLNEAGMSILKYSEGYTAKPENDCLGIPTVGIGTIVYPNGVHVQLGDPEITLEKALEYLNYELREKSATVEDWLNSNHVELSDNQFSALLCFAYNCGTGPITHPSSLNRAILKKDGPAIRKAFMLYVKGTKKILGIPYKVTLKGLVIRRGKEASLYFS